MGTITRNHQTSPNVNGLCCASSLCAQKEPNPNTTVGTECTGLGKGAIYPLSHLLFRSQFGHARDVKTSTCNCTKCTQREAWLNVDGSMDEGMYYGAGRPCTHPYTPLVLPPPLCGGWQTLDLLKTVQLRCRRLASARTTVTIAARSWRAHVSLSGGLPTGAGSRMWLGTAARSARGPGSGPGSWAVTSSPTEPYARVSRAPRCGPATSVHLPLGVKP